MSKVKKIMAHSRNFEATILDIREESYESESDVVCDTVLVTLKKGELADPTARYFDSTLCWEDDKGNSLNIDFVQAVFLPRVPVGETGNIALKFTLKEGEFNQETPISTALTPTPTETQQHLDCISVAKVDGDSLTLKFLSPDEGQVVTYPTVYFLTDYGIIDPGLGAMRIPP